MPTSRRHSAPASHSADSGADQSPAGDRGISRGWLLVLAALLAGTVGFVATWLASGPVTPVADEPIDFGLVPKAQVGDPNTIADNGADALPGPPDGLPERVDLAPESVEALRKEATSVADALVDNLPDQPDALEVAARLHAKLGDSDEAAANWQQCLQIAPNYAYAYHGLAGLAARRGEHDEAIKLYRRALISQPGLLMTQLELADALINVGRLDEAIELLERNVKMDPQAYRGYVLLGMAYLQKQDYEKAKASYEAALRLAPQHASALIGLTNVYRRLGQPEEVERYEQAYRKSRDSETEQRLADRQIYDDQQVLGEALAAVYIDAGQVYWTQQRAPNAERLWRRSLVLNSQDIRPYQALAALYVRQGQLPSTIDMFLRLLDVDPTHYGARMELARLYAQTGQPEAAASELKRLCEDAPQDPEPLAALAQLFSQLEGRTEDALTAAEKAVELNPSADLYALLGSIKNSAGDKPGAMEAFRRAADLAPEKLQYLQMYNLLKEQQ